MVSPCNPKYFLNKRPSRQTLVMVFTLMWHCYVTETAAEIHLRGEVGANVTIDCPVDKQKTITFFYFQKGREFVNGYHTIKNLPPNIKTWENTRVDSGKTTVHMFNLNVSHSGDYECLIRYSDSDAVAKTAVHVNVTGTYSKPEVTMKCTDGLSCLVICASHSGYPGTKMMWSVPASDMWKVVNDSEIKDRNTMMVNSSSTAYFNCSGGELSSLSCSVGDVKSDNFSVCEYCTSYKERPYIYLIAAVVSVGFGIGMVFLLWWKCKKGKTGGATGDVRQECRGNGCEGEVVLLSERKGEEEAV